MRTTVFARFATQLVLALAGGACAVTAPFEPESWGSDRATLELINGVTTLRILASGCYGSYGELDQPIPTGTFRVAGQYTQLSGAFPGKTVYPATYTGMKGDSQITVTITVAALLASFGPFLLTRGVHNTWARCLYP